jgi:hypothetical protein
MTYAVYGTAAYPYGTATRYYGVGADTVLRWGIDIDWDGDGLYSGDNDGIYAVDFKTRRGRLTYLNIDSDGDANGFEPVRVGTATLVLDNSSRRYDPYNTSSALYPNVQPGRYIRIRNLYNGTTNNVFHGKIRKITSIDTERDQRVRLELEDGLRLLQTADSSVAIQQSVDIDDAIQLVLTNIGWPSIFGTNLDDASDVLGYWWADDRAATEIRKLAEAELGQFYAAADGSATFRSRHHSAAAVLTLTSADYLKEIDLPQPLEVIRNVVKLKAHPRILRATGDLWTLVDMPSIAANGGTLTVWATYAYNNTTVPAINVVSPVATTDYTMNTQEDGGGTNLTSSFTVTLTDFGRTGKLVITNNHAALAGFVTLLKVRGDAIDAPDASILIEEDTASQSDFGNALLTIDNDWLQDTSLANDLCQWLISYMPNPQKFLTVKLEARPDIQFAADLFDLINNTISRLSIASVNYRVAGIEHEWISDNGQATLTTWYLEPNPGLSSFWQFTTTIGVTSVFGI